MSREIGRSNRAPRRRPAAVVRRAVSDDLDAVDRIEAEAFAKDRFPRRNLAHLLNSRSATALIAESGGKALGYVLLLFRKGASVARVYSIATAPEARGRGIAANLLRAAEACARKRGGNRLRLEVRASNRAARGLYEKAGFAIRKRLPNYYDDGETALQMEKRLGVAEGPR